MTKQRGEEKLIRQRQRAKGTGCIYRLKNSRSWWIACTSGGRQHCESSKSERKKDAQTLLTQRLGDVGRGIAVTPRLGKITLGAGLKAVVNSLKANGRDDTATRTERRIEMHILKYFNPDRRMAAVMTSDLEAYIAHRQEQETISLVVPEVGGHLSGRIDSL